MTKLSKCKGILQTRITTLKEKKNDPDLLIAYNMVLNDLIDHTDCCTGELY